MMLAFKSLLVVLISACYAAEEELLWSTDHSQPHPVGDERTQQYALQIQCTRRYSPGKCLDEVKPVWTYNYHLQNCTERMGCRQQTTVNRFKSYKKCMESCQSLAFIYEHILSQTTDWNNTDKAQLKKQLLRGSQALEESLAEPEDEPPTQYHSPELFHSSIMEEREDPESISLAELIPPDIDKLASDFVYYDPIHQQIHRV